MDINAVGASSPWYRTLNREQWRVLIASNCARSASVKRIVDAKAQFRSLAEPWADSSSSTGRLMLAVLGGLAEVERDLIRTRTAEGRSRAKAQGKHMGPPPSLTPAQQKEAIRRRAPGPPEIKGYGFA